MGLMLVLLMISLTAPADGKTIEATPRDVGCQERFTLGRDYTGWANTTKSGLPCKKWTDTKVNGIDWSVVGDHNYCRNPYGFAGSGGVFCYKTSSESEYCAVPFCPKIKLLDW